jgi:hypothetical protein
MFVKKIALRRNSETKYNPSLLKLVCVEGHMHACTCVGVCT